MGFGWGGLGGYRGSGWSFTGSFVFGIVLGSAMVWVLGRVLEWVYRLQSHGNVSIHDTIGLEGSVYAQVPGSGAGKGQVRLIVGERERFFNAITDGDALETRTRIRVVDVNDDNTITVAAADAEE